jgi:hypothetical protein
LVASLIVFITAFAYAGMAAAVDNGGNVWYSPVVAGLVGMFFGRGLTSGKLVDFVVGPPGTPDQAQEQDAH